MSGSALSRRLVACLLNISEARRRDLVETVAKAAITDAHGENSMHGMDLLNLPLLITSKPKIFQSGH